MEFRERRGISLVYIYEAMDVVLPSRVITEFFALFDERCT